MEIVGAVGGRPREGGPWSISGVSTDSRAVKEGDLFFAISGPNHDGHEFVADAFAKGAAGAVVSREVDLPEPQAARCIHVKDTRRALGRLAAHTVRTWGGQVIAVTGSNGKTTTKEMTHAALAGRFRAVKSPSSFNNEVGVPRSIFQLEAEDQFAVLELGTSAPGEIRRLAELAQPVVGVVTNIGETHLEGLGSLKGVAKAKAELLDELPEHGTAILNADDPMTPWLRKWCACDVITFGFGDGADIRGTDMQADSWGSCFAVQGDIPCRLRVPGRHNACNALAAMAACSAVGVGLRDAAERLAEFQPPDMRLSRREVGGVTVVNDAYNANIRSMQAALDVLSALPVEGRRIMICGDMLEMGMSVAQMHRQLGMAIAGSRVELLVTVGDWAWRAGETARRHKKSLELIHCAEAADAGETLAERVRPGDIVLVKGSRAMRLEEAVERLCERVARSDGDGNAVDADAVGSMA